jgi:hypothetical protein
MILLTLPSFVPVPSDLINPLDSLYPKTPCIPFLDFVEFPRIRHEKEGQNKAGNSL